MSKTSHDDQLGALARPLVCKSVFEDDAWSWIENCCSRVFSSGNSMAKSSSIGAAKAMLKERANSFVRSTHTPHDILLKSWP